MCFRRDAVDSPFWKLASLPLIPSSNRFYSLHGHARKVIFTSIWFLSAISAL